MSTGAVKCWGRNGWGQLGDGSTNTRLTPVSVDSLSSGVKILDAGYEHTCALLSSGGVKCWGYNYYGQIGNGTSGSGTHRLTPVDVQGLSSGVKKIAVGTSHNCALLSSGAVKCWGANTYGQIGDGTSGADRLTPVPVSGISSGVQGLMAGFRHTCAFFSSGALKCWGQNGYGQLGDGTSGTSRLTPVDVSGLASGVSEVVGGDWHTCALLPKGILKCWGNNSSGALGIPDHNHVPKFVKDPSVP